MQNKQMIICENIPGSTSNPGWLASSHASTPVSFPQEFGDFHGSLIPREDWLCLDGALPDPPWSVIIEMIVGIESGTAIELACFPDYGAALGKPSSTNSAVFFNIVQNI